MLIGVLVGVRMDMVLGIGMPMGELIGDKLGMISGVGAFVEAVMILCKGMPMGMLVGVGVDEQHGTHIREVTGVESE